jgi:two-component system, OmpR family, sensor histidine kinase TctE
MLTDTSLRQRLLIWLLVPLVLLMLLQAWWAYRNAVQVANEAHDRGLYLASRTLAEELYWEQGRLRLDVLRGAGYLFENHTGARLFYRVDDLQGNWLAGNPSLPMVPAGTQTDVQFFSLVQYADGAYREEAIRLLRLTHVVDSAEGHSVPLLITVGETREIRSRLIAQVLREALFAQAILAMLVLVLVWVAVRIGLKPLDAYRMQLAQRADDDLTEIEVPKVARELRPLFEALNGYLSRLSRLIDVRKRFIENAAHQLRTPLTVLKTQLALASRSSSADDMHSLIQAATQTTDGAVQLTEQLLALTRAEHAREMQASENVDLVELAQSIAEEWAGKAHARGIDLGFEATVAASPVLAIAPLVKEAIINLIENAITHAPGPESGAWCVTLRVSERCFEVEDNGRGIPRELQTKVFERFFRSPGSAAGGNGLGLAIVREIAIQHQADLQLWSPVFENSGTRVRMTFRSG